jgi:hypothetical protein
MSLLSLVCREFVASLSPQCRFVLFATFSDCRFVKENTMPQFLETHDGFVNLDHVKTINLTKDFDFRAEMTDGTVVSVHGSLTRPPLALFDFVPASGFQHLYIDATEQTQYLTSVVGLYVARWGDQTVPAVLLEDGVITYIEIDLGLASASLLVSPSGTVADGAGSTFTDVAAAVEWLADRVAAKHRTPSPRLEEGAP